MDVTAITLKLSGESHKQFAEDCFLLNDAAVNSAQCDAICTAVPAAYPLVKSDGKGF
jgi:hypothetical protein